MDKLQAEIDKVNKLENNYKAFFNRYLIEGSFKDIEYQADQKCANARYVLSQIYDSEIFNKYDRCYRFRYSIRSAEQGNVFAQCFMGDYYFKEEEVEEGFEWYMKSAKQGYIVAQIKIAECYYTGKGVAKCEQKAYGWLRKASNSHFVLPQKTLENDNTALIQDNSDLIKTVKRLQTTVKRLLKDKKELIENNTKLMEGK